MAPIGSPAQVSFLQKVQKTKAIDPSALFDQVVKSQAFSKVDSPWDVIWLINLSPTRALAVPNAKRMRRPASVPTDHTTHP